MTSLYTLIYYISIIDSNSYIHTIYIHVVICPREYKGNTITCGLYLMHATILWICAVLNYNRVTVACCTHIL